MSNWTEYNANMQWHEFDYNEKTNPTSVPEINPPAGGNPTYGDYYSNNYPMRQMFVPKYEDSNYPDDFETEPPLLEELGINFSHIKEKTFAVLNPTGSTSVEVIDDQDLAGPVVFCLLLGFALLLHGKLSFGEIYGIAIFGCTLIYGLLNAMGGKKTISFCCTASILGYCLLPMTILSFLIAVLPSKTLASYILASLAVLWCTRSSSKLIVTAMDLGSRHLLITYPCFLIYSMFALLAIF